MLKCGRPVEGGGLHAQRIEDLALYRSVVSGPKLFVWIKRMRAGVAGSCGHQIGVLKELAELTGRLHGPQLSQDRLWGSPLAVQQPLHILSRKPGAGADQVLHQHLAGCRGVTEFEAGQYLDHRRVPTKLLLIDLAREHQGGQRLGVGRDHEQRIGIDSLRLGQFADAEAAREDDLAMIDETDGDAGHVELLARALHELLQHLHPSRIQRMSRLTGERLAGVALGQQVVEDHSFLRCTLLLNSVVHVHDGDGVVASATIEAGAHSSLIVG